MTDHNQVSLEGWAVEEPKLSHENHGLRFYRMTLRVPRLSGQEDLLPVLLPEPLLSMLPSPNPLPQSPPSPDPRSLCLPSPALPASSALRIEGQFRSFNNHSGVGSRLILSVYARAVSGGQGMPLNRILLSGTVCRQPIFRKTPLGRSICDLMIAVPRRYGKSDYLPVIAWGHLARQTSSLCPGDSLSLEGRIQSRIYHKTTEIGKEERTAYEVSMMRLAETMS